MDPYTHGGMPVSRSISNIIAEIVNEKQRKHVRQKVGRYLTNYFELMKSASRVENKAHRARILLFCRDSTVQSLSLLNIDDNLRSHIENLVKAWHKEYHRGIKK